MLKRAAVCARLTLEIKLRPAVLVIILRELALALLFPRKGLLRAGGGRVVECDGIPLSGTRTHAHRRGRLQTNARHHLISRRQFERD
jgi:hypothetical protein